MRQRYRVIIMFISLAAALEFFQVRISLFLSFNGLHVTKEYGKLQW